MNQEVTDYIQNTEESHQKILTKLRKLILSAVPKAREQYKWSRPVYGLEKDFCYLQNTKRHVTFGFHDFEKISTNKHLIEGTGKSMRHVKLKDIKDLDEFQIKQMIKELIH